MGIKFGEIDASQILENEFRIMVLEGIIERLLAAAPPGSIGQEDIEQIRTLAVKRLKEKYPKSGIRLTAGA